MPTCRPDDLPKSLMKACKDFEAFLLSYLLRQMWQAAECVGGEKTFMSQAYRDMFTFEFAQSLVPSLRLGIAETLYRELSVGAVVDEAERSPNSLGDKANEEGGGKR